VEVQIKKWSIKMTLGGEFLIRGAIQSSNDSSLVYGKKVQFTIQKRIEDRVLESDE
jgi:hypothetical protein